MNAEQLKNAYLEHKGIIIEDAEPFDLAVLDECCEKIEPKDAPISELLQGLDAGYTSLLEGTKSGIEMIFKSTNVDTVTLEYRGGVYLFRR